MTAVPRYLEDEHESTALSRFELLQEQGMGSAANDDGGMGSTAIAIICILSVCLIFVGRRKLKLRQILVKNIKIITI